MKSARVSEASADLWRWLNSFGVMFAFARVFWGQLQLI